MKKISIYLFFIIISQSLFAQSEKVTQENILKAFEKENNIFKDWYSCNQENAFFKSDTVSIYNNADYYLQNWTCMELIQLKFQTNKSFIQTQFSFNHVEKTSQLLENGLFQIVVTSKNDSVFIHKYQNEKLIDNFLVKELSEFPLNDKRYTSKKITLIRIH